MSELYAVLEDLYEEVDTKASARREGRVDLRRSADCDRWYLRVAADEAWVAVPETSGGGGGWYRSDLSLDPDSRGWELVDANDVLASVGHGARRAADLTAEMLASCITDGLGLIALELADALLDQGYGLKVSVSR
jgi:hypothetical protein